MLSQSFSVIIDHEVIAPGNVIEVLGGFNSIEKQIILKLMSKVQLLGAKGYYT